jgi:hypothetical protein
MVAMPLDFYPNDGAFWDNNALLGYTWIYCDCLAPGAEDERGYDHIEEMEDSKEEFRLTAHAAHLKKFWRNCHPEILW